VIAAIYSLLSLSVFAQTVSDGPGSQPSAPNANQQPKSDNPPLTLEAVQRELGSITRAIEAHKDDAEAKRKEQREESDLKAQWQMARWAKYAVYVAIGALILTVAGVFLIWRTLIHTRRAADAARDMVVEGEKATKATVIAATAAQSAAEASLAAERARFFIVVDETNFTSILNDHVHRYDEHGIFGGSGRASLPKIKYRIRNYGKTPGIIKELSTGMILSTEPIDCVYSVQIDSFSETMIAAGDTTKQREHDFWSALDNVQAAAIQNNQARLWFFGRVDYDDVMGRNHTHRFYFRTVWWEGACILQPFEYKHYNQST
jgi:hypothetical protein